MQVNKRGGTTRSVSTAQQERCGRTAEAGGDMGNPKNLAARIERKLENTVGDAFARVFGGSIVPQEVEAGLRREAADGVRSLQGGRLLAPNEYLITLSEPDYEKVRADRDLTSDTFAKHLSGYIGEQGWQTYGDVVVRFEPSPSLHTGQFRARGVVNPDAHPQPSAGEPIPPQSEQASTAEPGVSRMSDNPSSRGDQGQGRPDDDYYDDRHGRPQDDPRGGQERQERQERQEPRAPYPPEPGGYPPQNEPRYAPRQGYPDQGGYQDQGGYPDQGYPPPSYEQRQGDYRPPGYDQGYRQGPGGYPPPGGGQQGYGPQGDYDYGRQPGPGRQEDYARDPRQPYPDQGGYDQGYPGRPDYGRRDYGQPDYGRYGDAPGYGEPQGRDYDYGQQGGQGGYGGYAPGDYPSSGTAVTLQLDDGSGRTYQLREGANVVGRGQDAQFRLPDTGVSRRHLEIRWDGQVALLSDLNSTNGTTVNNAPVQEWQLADGDVIRLGHSEIVVRVH
jgi:Protein of unknown function (DUF3662)/FHA domain